MILAAVLLLGASPAGAAFFNAGARETAGNENYRGEYAYADFGGGLHFRPSFSAYHDDLSSGTYKTIAGRLAYDAEHWGLGISGGGTPLVNGYSNRFVGADGTLSLTSGGGAYAPRKLQDEDMEDGTVAPKEEDGRGWGLERVDFGAGITYTIHGEKFRNGILPDSSSLNIAQTDLRGTLRFVLLRDLFSFDLTHSRYDHDINAADAQAAQVQSLAGLDASIQGFPNTSATARVDLSMIPVLTPYASYSHTTFELAQPSLYVYAAGVYLDVKFIELFASYQRLVQASEPTLNLSTLGAGVRF